MKMNTLAEVIFDTKKNKLLSKITLNRKLKNGNTRIAHYKKSQILKNR